MQAKSVVTFWLGAANDSLQRDHTLVGILSGVTEQCAIAHVPIFQLPAVFIVLAVAGDGSARTHTVRALVCNCARIIVVAGG